jgi:hypothetical protein
MVIAMLTTGAIFTILFGYVEWRVSLLPMMPCKPHFATLLPKLQLITDSVTIQEHGYHSHYDPKFLLRRRLLLLSVLPPNLLPERQTIQYPQVSSVNHSNGPHTSGCFGPFRTVHQQNESLW